MNEIAPPVWARQALHRYPKLQGIEPHADLTEPGPEDTMPRQLVVHDPERGMARSIPYDLTEEQADAWMADVRLLVVERPEAMLWMLDPEGTAWPCARPGS